MTNKSVVIAIVIFVLLSCCFLILAGGQYFVNDCLWWDCAPKRNFRVSDLELPSTLFPDVAIVNHIRPMSDEFTTIEDGLQSIYWDNGNGLAGYDIYRYATIKKAIRGFEFNYKQMVDDGTKKPWIRPSELTYSSSTANQLQIACGIWIGRRCGMLARYQEYVVFFDAVMDDKMTYSDFERIVIYIDEQMSAQLSP